MTEQKISNKKTRYEPEVEVQIQPTSQQPQLQNYTKRVDKKIDYHTFSNEAKKEFYDAVKKYCEFGEKQKEIDPNYSIVNLDYQSDATKFGLRWFFYGPDIAKRKGDEAMFDINGTTYIFKKNQWALILKRDEGNLASRLAMDHFQGLPKNINRLITISDEQARLNYISSIAEEWK